MKGLDTNREKKYVSLTQKKLYDMPWRNCNHNRNAQNNFFYKHTD